MAVRQRYRLQQVLTALLRAHPEGLQVVDCWILVGPGRTYHTVYTALRRLCRKGLLVQVGVGRYAIAVPPSPLC